MNNEPLKNKGIGTGFDYKDERFNQIFSFEDVKSAVEWLKSKISNNYPEDIFLPLTKDDYVKINQCLNQRLGFSLDRLSANIMRLKEKIDLELVDEAFADVIDKEE